MANWIQHNFLYAIVLGVILVIVGGGIAFKADNKFGYIIFFGGFGLILWTMRLWGLI